ncbi:PREDICTED: F-box only protein 28 [Papilio polytes]|uniref:F-box only protein 28 n=1 Tax=Papilio polytes TaxID=76194 RepID=UPI000676ACE6|nr:PREDICTED: F-box only protein 28 [Papilio polytes]
MDLLDLPIIIVEHIISQLTYDEMAKYRLVCKAFNEICMRKLTRGFHMIEKRHALALKTVKTQLPRRESERRYHPLARHCDILTSIETRISMLNMTYSKFIDSGMCCFIPGRVIDEIQRILEVVETNKSPPRAHEVLQELRDISSMAIEHFDDKISPEFRKRLQDITVTIPIPRPVSVATIQEHNTASRQEFIHLRQMSTANAKLSLFMSSQYKMFYKRIMLYKRIALRHKKTIRELTKRQREQDAAICELKKRLDECDIKYNEITHTNQAVGGKAIAESKVTGVSKSQSLRHFGSQIKLDLSLLPIGNSKLNQKLLPNIKPRKAQVKLPTFDDSDSKESHVPSPSVPSPSTCGSSGTRTRAQMRGLAYEITALSNNLSKSLENKTKRTIYRQDNGEAKRQRFE